jgi:Flp pilus assembly pilin Flp
VIALTLRNDRGQGLAEYALVLGFIAVLCIGALLFIGASVVTHYNNISNNYP